MKSSPPLIFQDGDATDKWSALNAEIGGAKGHLTQWGLSILKTGLNPYAKSIVLERDYICKDHRNLFSNFYSKKFFPQSANCHRLHFFGCSGITPEKLKLDLGSLQTSYIGHSVIRPVKDRCLGRTVLDPQKVGRKVSDGFFTLQTGFKVHLNGPTLTAHGFPFMSQDGEATVCAHAATWSACRYLSERYTVYPETYPYDIVESITDTQGRILPYHGFYIQDYSKIFIKFGCHPEIFPVQDTATKKMDPTNFLKLSAYVESGFPSLISYDGHVACVVGHTLNNAAKVVPNKSGWIDSSAFLKQLIVVDDNLFPYTLLGFPGDPENGYNGLSSVFTLDSIKVAVCPLPEKAYLPAEKARKVAETVLTAILKDRALKDELTQKTTEPLVLRLFLTTSSSFKRRKIEKSALSLGEVDLLGLKITDYYLPHFVWVMEVSTLSKYLDGFCSGEIVLDATANEFGECLLYARAGGKAVIGGTTISAHSSPIFCQYTHNLGEL